MAKMFSRKKSPAERATKAIKARRRKGPMTRFNQSLPGKKKRSVVPAVALGVGSRGGRSPLSNQVTSSARQSGENGREECRQTDQETSHRPQTNPPVRAARNPHPQNPVPSQARIQLPKGPLPRPARNPRPHRLRPPNSKARP